MALYELSSAQVEVIRGALASTIASDPYDTYAALTPVVAPRCRICLEELEWRSAISDAGGWWQCPNHHYHSGPDIKECNQEKPAP